MVASMLFAYMFPPLMLVIPMSALFRIAGLADSLWGLLIAHLAISLPLAVWLLWGFFKSMPFDLEEAAMVDGCSQFGAFIKVEGFEDGMVHISQIADYHVEIPEDVLSVGQQVYVKCVEIKDGGRIAYSMKAVNQATGEDLGLGLEEDELSVGSSDDGELELPGF